MTTPTKRRSCEGKRRHTEASARAEVRRLEQDAGVSPGRLEAYDCKHCPHWHVGHTAEGRR